MQLIWFYIRYLFRFFRFYWKAQTCYDVHSPFVSRFLAETLEDRRQFYVFDQVLTIREALELNDDPINIVDHGAGSQLRSSKVVKVRQLARSSAIFPAAGRLLFRIARFLRPSSTVELGTSLGISAIYQIAASPNAHMVTIEGNPELAVLARRYLKLAGYEQVQVEAGTFREVLPAILQELKPVDFFHFDGDHRYQPTLDYFEQCLPYCHNDSVFCIGDIYWSAEMEQAWRELKAHPEVRLSIDLFHFGLLFLRAEQREKEDFTLVPSHWKPWRMGFW